MNEQHSTTGKVCTGVHLPEKDMPLKLSLLRWKLGCKAKQEPEFRFYALYDLLYRRDVLETAYKLAKGNDGSAGVDNVMFEDIEKSDIGLSGVIDKLEDELRRKGIIRAQ